MKTAYDSILDKAEKVRSATSSLEYCLGERDDVERKIKN